MKEVRDAFCLGRCGRAVVLLLKTAERLNCCEKIWLTGVVILDTISPLSPFIQFMIGALYFFSGMRRKDIRICADMAVSFAS